MNGQRLSCIVPFCTHTRAFRNGEWICGDHWRAVPLRLKQLLSSAKRKRRYEAYMTVWGWCRSAAIEIAAGIRR